MSSELSTPALVQPSLLTGWGVRDRRDSLQVADVCVPAVFGLQGTRTPAWEMG